MKNCQCDTREVAPTVGNLSKKVINEEMMFITRFLDTDGPAIEYGSDHEVYEHLKGNQKELGIFVSDKHVQDIDLGTTFYMIARSKEDYEKYEENFVGQHDPEATLGIGEQRRHS